MACHLGDKFEDAVRRFRMAHKRLERFEDLVAESRCDAVEAFAAVERENGYLQDTLGPGRLYELLGISRKRASQYRRSWTLARGDLAVVRANSLNTTDVAGMIARRDPGLGEEVWEALRSGGNTPADLLSRFPARAGDRDDAPDEDAPLPPKDKFDYQDGVRRAREMEPRRRVAAGWEAGELVVRMDFDPGDRVLQHVQNALLDLRGRDRERLALALGGEGLRVRVEAGLDGSRRIPSARGRRIA